jgi:Aspartyl/Asparaginyl beta-hydroxylase
MQHKLQERPQSNLQGSGYLKLPVRFDVQRLQDDLRAADDFAWVAHFNTAAYDEGWSCLALRSVQGRLDHVMPIDGLEYQDTEILARCPYFQEVLAQLPCTITSVRLMALEPGAQILPHRDKQTSLEDGITRLHVPIQTTPEVLFCIDGQEVHFSAGDLWYLNASCTHAVTNGSALRRVHLMLDCITNPWLEQLFVQAGGRLRPAPAYGDASINDANVQGVIAALLAGGHPAGVASAQRLRAIAAQRI